MTGKELIRHLLSTDLDARISCVNLNDQGDEFADTSKTTADITAISEHGDGTAIYYIGDVPPKLEDDTV